MRSVAEAFVFAAVLLALLMALRFLAGCAAAKADEAEAGYAVQQLACVDKYADKASIDACRAKVRAAWAKDAAPDSDITVTTSKDAGHE